MQFLQYNNRNIVACILCSVKRNTFMDKITLRSGALRYKTIARFEFQDLSEHQNKNPAVKNVLNVWRFFCNGVFQAKL